MLVEQTLSDKILKSCFEVHQVMGPGLSEKVYQKALFHKINDLGLMVSSEKNYRVFFENHLVGDYYADLVVENCIIIEVKSAITLSYNMEAQLLNYLNIAKASGVKAGYLVNFRNVRLDWKRFVV